MESTNDLFPSNCQQRQESEEPHLQDWKNLQAGDVVCSTNHRYTIIKKIGEGAFGAVFSAKIPSCEDAFALKMVKNSFDALREQRVLQMFLTEHQRLPKLVDSFSIEPEHFCFVFRLFTKDLEEYVSSAGIPILEVRKLLFQLLEALEELEELQLIHRDIKLNNIMFTSEEEDEIVLIDFGKACLEGEEDCSRFQHYYFSAPEVMLSYRGPLTRAVDMFSVGAVGAWLYLGESLFTGESQPEVLTNMAHILSGQSELLKEFAQEPATSPWKTYCGLEDIIMRSQTIYGSLRQKEDYVAFCLALSDLLKRMMEVDPCKRISVNEAKNHPFFSAGFFPSNNISDLDLSFASAFKEKNEKVIELWMEKVDFEDDESDFSEDESSEPSESIIVEEISTSDEERVEKVEEKSNGIMGWISRNLNVVGITVGVVVTGCLLYKSFKR